MMKDYKRITMSGVAAASLLMAGAAPVFTAETAQAEELVAGVSESGASADAADERDVQAAEGEFAWDQTTVTPNWRIASLFRNAVANLCGSLADLAIDNPLEWKLKVTGDVENEFTATVDDMASEQSVEDLMSCTCGSNPADGAAIVTADVKGIPVTYLLERAEAVQGANTITFVSSDGFEQAMPLGYVVGRHAVISYEINGEDLSASVGGNNQLWMTRTAASYFVRDIVEVRITKEAEPPATPGDGLDYPNSPNVGITGASVE